MGDDTQLPIVTSDAEALRRIDRPDPPFNAAAAAPVGLGIGWIDQVVALQRSANVTRDAACWQVPT
jgi:hypothetical protein